LTELKKETIKGVWRACQISEKKGGQSFLSKMERGSGGKTGSVEYISTLEGGTRGDSCRLEIGQTFMTEVANNRGEEG